MSELENRITKLEEKVFGQKQIDYVPYFQLRNRDIVYFMFDGIEVCGCVHSVYSIADAPNGIAILHDIEGCQYEIKEHETCVTRFPTQTKMRDFELGDEVVFMWKGKIKAGKISDIHKPKSIYAVKMHELNCIVYKKPNEIDYLFTADSNPSKP